MECSTVQKKLSEYIDRAIPPKECKIIEEHLISCKKCTLEFEEMKNSIEHVRNLEEIEPPPWLKNKIMAKVMEEAEEKKGILQKLFCPFNLKIPLRVAAVIVIAAVSVFLIKEMQPEIKEIKTLEFPQKEAPSLVTEEKESVQKKDIKKPLKKTEKSIKQAEKPLPAAEKDSFVTAKPSGPIMFEHKKEASAGKEADTFKDEFKSEEKNQAVELKKKTTRQGVKSEVTAENVKYTVYVKDSGKALDNIEKIIVRLGGKIVKKMPLEDKILILAELNMKKEAELLERLNLTGEVQKKSGTLHLKYDVIIIRIEIIKR